MKVVAIVPAAGAGKRLKGKTKKQFLILGGKPIVARTLLNLSAANQIDEIILLAPPGEIDYCRENIVDAYEIGKVSLVAQGGATRQESVARGFDYTPEETDMVLVHDGARPFITQVMISGVIEAAADCGAAVTAVFASDTLKEVDNDGVVVSTLARERIVRAQTPQCFRYCLLKEAMEKAEEEGFAGTDEASLVERLGARVRVVEGSETNIKITTLDDLKLAEALLSIGSRY